MNFKINKQLIKHIASKYKLNYLVLFGSRADGTAKETSDYDVAFSTKHCLSYIDEAGIAEALSAVFKISSSRIDTVNIKNAGPLLKKEISDKGIILFEKEKGAFANFQIYAFMNYVEAKPLFALRSAMIKDKIKNL